MRAHCPYCDTVCDVVRTVAWQTNVCAECGNDVPAEEN